MRTVTRVVLVALPLLALAGCAGTLGAGSPQAEAAVTLAIRWPAPVAARDIPAETDHIAITVTAAGMTTVERTIDSADVVGDFAQVRFGVPAGTARHFHVEAQDASDNMLTEGDATVDLVAGTTTRLVVELL